MEKVKPRSTGVPCPFILRVDEQDPNAAACQPLRISYKHPRFEDLITEEVYLDPRDSLLGDKNGLLLVHAAGVSGLQQKSDRSHRWAESAEAITSSLRRDYLREQQYLLGELRRLAHSVPKAVEKDINELIDGAMKSSEEACEDAANIASAADVQFLAESFGGPSLDEDEELLEHFRKVGLDGEDEMTLRMLLTKMRLDVQPLMQQREELRKAVEAMEADSKEGEEGLAKLIQAMLREAEDQSATRKDIIDACLGRAASMENRRAVEDSVTKNLRKRYEDAVAKFESGDPKAAQWRETLAKHEMKVARHFALKLEVEAEEEKLSKREEAEQVREETKEKRREARRAEQASILQAHGQDGGHPQNKEVEKLMDRMLHKMPEQVQVKVREQQVQHIRQRRMTERIERDLSEVEAKVQAFEERKAAIGARVRKSRAVVEERQEQIQESEEQSEQVEEVVRRISIQHSEAKVHREELEDELQASHRPPPKPEDTRRLEEDVQQAIAKLEELKQQKSVVNQKELEYEARFMVTQSVWKVRQEELAAEALLDEQDKAARRAEAAAEEEAQRVASRKVVEDPELLSYKERMGLPEYSKVSRSVLLNADSQARLRRLGEKQQGASEEEAEQLLARMRSCEHQAVLPNGPKSQVPVGFRRPEDIKVRLAGAEHNIGLMQAHYSASGTRGAQLAEELRTLGRQLVASAAGSQRVHAEVPRRLAAYLRGGGSAPSSSSLRKQLVSALETHEVTAKVAEDAWRQTELGCLQGASEAELELEEEACARCEEDLTIAAQGVYGAAAEAARTGPHELAAYAEKCVTDWDTAEPDLVHATIARGDVWPRILGVAGALARERTVRVGWNKHLQAETRRRNLLDAERTVPAEAKRALAAMRSAASTSGRMTSMLLE